MQTTWDLTLIFKDDLEFEKEYKYESENINELANVMGSQQIIYQNIQKKRL